MGSWSLASFPPKRHPTSSLHDVFRDIEIGLHPHVLSLQLTIAQIQQQDVYSTLPV